MSNEIHLCIYCNQQATHQFKNGKWCCSPHMNGCPEIKRQRKERATKQWKETKNLGFSKLNENIKENNFTPNICAYCGQPAKYQLKSGKWCCEPVNQRCPAIKEKNRKAVQKLYDEGKLNQQEILKNRTKESFERQGWSKGLSKHTDERIKNRGNKLHERYESGELIHAWIGKKHTIEEIDKIVYGMSHFRPNKNLKGFKHGWYKGYWCDSSWELAFIMYNLDHNIKFERNEQGFNYLYNGYYKRFYPDFIIDGEYIEIKGYSSKMTDAKIQWFPKDLILKVYYKDDMDVYLKYAIETYGIDFWKLLTDEEK